MKISVKTILGGYDIFIGHGLLNEAGNYMDLNRKAIVVTDDGVPKSYAIKIASQCKDSRIITIPQGEASKNFETLQHILKEMLLLDMTRNDCIIAVGGGVVGDLTGFAASCYMRGIDFYNVPTTVLSQVDSSIGGKTAIDFCGYKNMVGAFWQPKGVLIDIDTLNTLPERQISNGLAEAIKMAATSDEELFSILEKEDVSKNMETVVCRALLIKKNIVEQDERERGIRKILNFGHTLGHAIESQKAREGYYHGECVAMGMMPMCSEEVRNRLIPVLHKFNLPTSTDYEIDTIIEAIKHDKKASEDLVALITVPEIGRFQIENKSLGEIKKIILEAKK